MTTHDDSKDGPDPRETTNAVGEVLANIIDPFTASLPHHYKTAADTVLTVLPYAGDIRYLAGFTVSRLITRLTGCRRKASCRDRNP